MKDKNRGDDGTRLDYGFGLTFTDSSCLTYIIDVVLKEFSEFEYRSDG